jgi:hypothetical protein
LAKKREIIHVTEHRRRMRLKVREMEAFGWILDDYDEMTGNMVRMKFWRPFERPNRDKIRELEFAMSRVSQEESIHSIKLFIAIIVCIFLTSLAWMYVRDFLLTVDALIICMTLATVIISGGKLRIKRRREVILREARHFSSGKKPPHDYFGSSKTDDDTKDMAKGDL